MNVPLIECEVEEAKRKLKAYRTNLHRDAEEQYAAVIAGSATTLGLKLTPYAVGWALILTAAPPKKTGSAASVAEVLAILRDLETEVDVESDD